MESHAMEQGQALQGALSAYALPVQLEDVLVDEEGGIWDST